MGVRSSDGGASTFGLPPPSKGHHDREPDERDDRDLGACSNSSAMVGAGVIPAA